MTRASHDDQVRLLGLQELDARIAQLEHRRRTLPEAAEVAELTARLTEARRAEGELAEAVAALDREVSRAERDVDQVRTRVDRDRQRLDAGTGSAKDLLGLQHELESLAARQSQLEDQELEIMERREAEAARLASVRDDAAATEASLAEATGRRDAAMAEVMTAGRAAVAARREAAAGVDGHLLTLYDKIRSQRSGVGAARFTGTGCDGCRMDFPPSEVTRVRAAGPDEVVRCEECGRILVRAD